MLQYKIVKSKTVLRYHPDPFWHEQTDDAPVWQQRQLVWAVGRVLFQVAVVDLEHDRRRIIRNHLNVCPDWLWDRRVFSFLHKLVRGFTGDVADRRHACSCGRKMKKHKMYVQLCKHYINSNQQKKMQIYKHEKHKNTKYIIMIFCKYELYMYYYYYTINIWYNMIIDIYNYK